MASLRCDEAHGLHCALHRLPAVVRHFLERRAVTITWLHVRQLQPLSGMDDVLGQLAENQQQVRINVLDAPPPERVGIPTFIDNG